MLSIVLVLRSFQARSQPFLLHGLHGVFATSMIVRDALDNGIRLVTESMGHVRSVSLGVWLTSGSPHDSEEESGIAHFVEHMLSKGTDTRSAENIAQGAASIGGPLDG